VITAPSVWRDRRADRCGRRGFNNAGQLGVGFAMDTSMTPAAAIQNLDGTCP
jgi:hypothetical protein